MLHPDGRSAAGRSAATLENPRPEGNNAEDAVYPGRRRSRSLAQRLQLPPHPLRVPHSAHLGVEAVGFAEFALAISIIAQERGELRPFTR